MAKAFKFNKKDTMRYGGMALGVTAGFIAGQKIQLAKLFKADPTGFVAKNEGWLKFGGALILIPFIKNEMLRSVLIGIAAGGAVSGVAKLMDKNGTSGIGRSFKYRTSAIGNEQPWATQMQVQSGAHISGQSHNHMLNPDQPFPQKAYGVAQDNGINVGVGKFRYRAA